MISESNRHPKPSLLMSKAYTRGLTPHPPTSTNSVIISGISVMQLDTTSATFPHPTDIVSTLISACAGEQSSALMVESILITSTEYVPITFGTIIFWVVSPVDQST